MQVAQIPSFGAPDVIQVVEVDRPSPGPGEVLVAVGASSINGHDTLVRSGVTALAALGPATHLSAGESVLVRGAAGGVGSAVVQLSHAIGGTVTALARSSQEKFLTDLGADHVVDYQSVTPGDLGSFDV